MVESGARSGAWSHARLLVSHVNTIVVYVTTRRVSSRTKGRLQVSFTVAPDLLLKAQADIGVEIPAEHRVILVAL